MTTETAEDAMRRACDSIMRGDIMTALADLTPEAFQEAMVMGANIVSLPTPESYDFTSREELPDGTHRFVVRFKTQRPGHHRPRLLETARRLLEDRLHLGRRPATGLSTAPPSL